MVESRSVYKCDTQIHPFSGWTHPFFPSEIREREMVLRWSTRQKLRRWCVPLLCHVPSWLHGRFGRWPRLQILGSQAPGNGGIAWMGNSFPPFTLYTYTTPVLWSQSYMVSSCFILHPPCFILEMFTGWTRVLISFFKFLLDLCHQRGSIWFIQSVWSLYLRLTMNGYPPNDPSYDHALLGEWGMRC